MSYLRANEEFTILFFCCKMKVMNTEYYYDVFSSVNLTSYMESPGDVSTCIILTYIVLLTVLVVYSYVIEHNINVELFVYLKTRKKINISESIYCVICMESNSSNHMMVQLDCGHKFHIDCLHKWLIVNPICPICRREDLFCPSKKSLSAIFSSETPLVLL